MRMPEHERSRSEHVIDVFVARRIPEARALAVTDDEPYVLGQRVAAERAAGEQALGVAELRCLDLGRAPLSA